MQISKVWVVWFTKVASTLKIGWMPCLILGWGGELEPNMTFTSAWWHQVGFNKFLPTWMMKNPSHKMVLCKETPKNCQNHRKQITKQVQTSRISGVYGFCNITDRKSWSPQNFRAKRCHCSLTPNLSGPQTTTMNLSHSHFLPPPI